MLQNRQLAAHERQLETSTRLARALSIPMTSALLPLGTVIVPLEMVAYTSSNEANVLVGIRQQQLVIAQNAILSARDSYQRNFDRILDGQGLPIEVLQSIQALELSQRAYRNAVANYNRAQLQLQWALGWPVTSASAIDSDNES